MSAARVGKMVGRERLLHTVDACNGEMRLMKARYESCWYCILALVELPDDIWESWENLVGGDNDFFEAREKIFAINDNFVATRALTPEAALSSAIEAATHVLDEHLDK